MWESTETLKHRLKRHLKIATRQCQSWRSAKNFLDKIRKRVLYSSNG